MAPSGKVAPKSPIIYTLFLVFLLATAIALGYSVAKPFLNTIIISITLSVLFYPLSQRICKLLKGHSSLASFLTVCIIVFAIIIPALFFFLGLIGQGVDSVSEINSWLKHADISKIMNTHKLDIYVNWIEDKIPFLELNSNDIKAKGIEYSKTFGQSMLTSGTWLAGNMAGLIAQFFIMTFLVFSFLKDGIRFIARIKYLSPLRAEQEDFIFTSLRKVSKSVLVGSLCIAVLQGFVGGVGLAIANIPALFWGTMMGFTSLIPVLGTGIIWVPAILYLLLIGNIHMAVFLGLWCGILVTGIDTILRPIIVRDSSRVSTIYVFLAILGGINAFGALGILYGPMILTFLMVMLDIYGLEFQDILKNKK